MATTTKNTPKADSKAEETPKVREFVYNGTTLEDPDPNMSEKDVQKMYSEHFTELTNATLSIENKPAQDGKPARKVVTFRKNVGTKG